ncbi:hypothetical protein OHA98_33555 [Streptomyces sp. NBC_00654]|uniref:hypothetical protein n=1 Tax=Streptomyces sp. NBC_00654 TaxID=2975799 RepID=UPI00224D1E70|nr:hypothetical protein [Streptomyces sp. NBC_00654]MCX4969599.1 hypothetical protein [Streptomyces sp. NBC_00654]
MLRHVIAPSSGYTKASNNVVRTRRMSSDAKILLLYVQGLPESARNRPLSELANRLDMTGRSYQRAKRQLIENGFVHEWRSQIEGGRWTTEQLFTNIPLTSAEAATLREGPSTFPPPSEQSPTVGRPTPRQTAGYQPVEDDRDKTTPHPPSEADPDPQPTAQAPYPPNPSPGSSPAPPETRSSPNQAISPSPNPAQLALAERILLSLRHTRRELHLGVREARDLALEAVKWLERGLGEADLRQALLAERPEGGVRSAVGFLRYRLTQKCPEPAPVPVPRPASAPSPASSPAPSPVRDLIACAGSGWGSDSGSESSSGSGEEHVFRPLGDETECAECRRATAYENWLQDTGTHYFPEGTPWRERFATVRAAEGLAPAALGGA